MFKADIENAKYYLKAKYPIIEKILWNVFGTFIAPFFDNVNLLTIINSKSKRCLFLGKKICNGKQRNTKVRNCISLIPIFCQRICSKDKSKFYESR